MVEILLATYNGEQFLRELLDSLIIQSFTDWRVTAQDDCSTDGTLKILEEYSEKYPDRINVIKTSVKFGSAKSNFFSLISQSTEEYVMLCDQDDVWLENKIETTLAEMRKIEASSLPGTPVLVHTDLTVVDSGLNTVESSLLDMQGMYSGNDSLCRLVVQNIVTGCTMIANRSLVNLLYLSDSDSIVIHDWWIAMVACCFGKIGFVNAPTMLYRQHGGNNVGAKNIRSFCYKWSRLVQSDRIKLSIARTYPQARTLLNAYRDKLKPEQISLLKDYCEIPNLSKSQRILKVFRLGTFMNGLSRNIAYLLFV